MVSTVTDTAFLTSDQYLEQQKTVKYGEDELGQDAFLTLFTAQLQNQNPLDPMANEAFVSQLAQFSSLEGIKGMQGSLDNMVSGMRQDQMVAGANLVGKKVQVAGGHFTGGNGEITQGSINLDRGAESIIFSVYNPTTGELIYRDTQGGKLPGRAELNWNGRDRSGAIVPEGSYMMAASAVVNGKLETVPVTTMADVKSVSWDPNAQQITLEVGDGVFVALAEIERIAI
jgi:flagellar basal-body rod modification protein FlgD